MTNAPLAVVLYVYVIIRIDYNLLYYLIYMLLVMCHIYLCAAQCFMYYYDYNLTVERYEVSYLLQQLLLEKIGILMYLQ